MDWQKYQEPLLNKSDKIVIYLSDNRFNFIVFSNINRNVNHFMLTNNNLILITLLTNIKTCEIVFLRGQLCPVLGQYSNGSEGPASIHHPEEPNAPMGKCICSPKQGWFWPLGEQQHYNFTLHTGSKNIPSQPGWLWSTAGTYGSPSAENRMPVPAPLQGALHRLCCSSHPTRI